MLWHHFNSIQQWQGQNIAHTLNWPKHPIPCPHRWAMGVVPIVRNLKQACYNGTTLNLQLVKKCCIAYILDLHCFYYCLYPGFALILLLLIPWICIDLTIVYTLDLHCSYYSLYAGFALILLLLLSWICIAFYYRLYPGFVLIFFTIAFILDLHCFYYCLYPGFALL